MGNKVQPITSPALEMALGHLGTHFEANSAKLPFATTSERNFAGHHGGAHALASAVENLETAVKNLGLRTSANFAHAILEAALSHTE